MSRGAEKTRVPLLMRDRSFYHTFLILAGTLILEQAVVLSVNLADNLMIGSYNETALAAVAAVNQIVFVVQQVIYGVTNGVIVLSSQYWGKQQTAPIRRLVCLGLRLEAALSMLFFAVVSLWPAQCVGLFVTDAAIIAEGVRYLRVIRFTFPFFAVTTVLLGAMRSVETVSLALKVSVVSLVTNCVINYILIFGRFGAPELGVVGAAIGTLAARTLECGIVCVYVFCRDRKLQLRAAELGRSDPALRGDYFRTSVPIVLQASIWRRSLNACWAAPNPGVLVTAPERIPAIEVMDVPEHKKMTKVVMILRATTIMLSRLRLLPPFLNEAKKPGPTSRPIE